MSHWLTVDPTDPLPLYAQLERGIRAAIASGRLKEGDRLPTVRQLAVDLRVNANTVAKVYLELERAGVLETRRGVGTFIRETPAPRSRKRERDTQLRTLFDHFVSQAAQLGYSPSEVHEHLVERVQKEK